MGTAPMGDDYAMQLKAPARSIVNAGRGSQKASASIQLRRAAGMARAPNSLAAYAARLPDREMPARSAARRPVPAKTVGSFVPWLTKPAFERYGFSAAALITDWDTIVGADIARYTMPERLKWPKRVEWSGDEVADEDRGRPGATLILAVTTGRALDIQYQSAQLVERINSYFGYRAVAGLRIVQVARIKPSEAPPALAMPPVSAPAKPHEELTQIAAPGLRAALERMAEGLGERMARRRARA